MNERLPRVTAAQVIRVLEKIGFEQTRQSDSHKIFKNQTGKRVTVAFHSGSVLHLKVLKSILVDAGLTVDEFRELL